MVVETAVNPTNALLTCPFNPLLAGMVVETLGLFSAKQCLASFNPLLAGMVVETVKITEKNNGL